MNGVDHILVIDVQFRAGTIGVVAAIREWGSGVWDGGGSRQQVFCHISVGLVFAGVENRGG